MRPETVEEFLARGGKIKNIKSSADAYAKKVPHTTHYHYESGSFPASVETVKASQKIERWEKMIGGNIHRGTWKKLRKKESMSCPKLR